MLGNTLSQYSLSSLKYSFLVSSYNRRETRSLPRYEVHQCLEAWEFSTIVNHDHGSLNADAVKVLLLRAFVVTMVGLHASRFMRNLVLGVDATFAAARGNSPRANSPRTPVAAWPAVCLLICFRCHQVRV